MEMNQLKAASASVHKYKEEYKKNVYTPSSWFGLTWLPEILVKGKIETMGSLVGSGVWAFGFLTSAQLFGLKGITAHSILYGTGMISSSLFLLLE